MNEFPDDFSDEFRDLETRVEQIYTMLESNPENWKDHISFATSLISLFDQTSFMSNPGQTDAQVWAITALQRLAYQDHDSGGIETIAEWCVIQWLKVLQNQPQNKVVLRGVFSGPQ